MIFIPYGGVPSSPLVVFWSGDVAILIRQVDYKIGNEFRTLIVMIPSDQMLWRYGIKESELRYDLSAMGAIARDYPKEHVHNLSANPELPISLLTCGFDNSISFDTRLHELSDKCSRLEKDIQNLLSENDNLKEMNKKQSEDIKELRIGLSD